MPRGLGLILFGGLGYILVYASVANSGRFATQPWAGLHEDAYTGKRSADTGADQAPSTAAPEPSQPAATLVGGGTRTVRRRNQGQFV